MLQQELVESAMKRQKREKFISFGEEGKYSRLKVMFELDLKEGTGI